MSRSIPESLWQRTVVACFLVNGWRVWHDTTAWRSDPGWPDLVCCHPTHGLRFVELKAERGRVSDSQESWHRSLREAGQLVYVFRPSDWLAVVAVAGGAVPGATQQHERSE